MADAHARGWGDPSSKGYRAEHIVTIDTPVGKLSVRSEVAHLFLGFLQEIRERGFRFNARSDDWGFAPRPIRGYEEKWEQTHDFHYWSNHGWGMAIDLDAIDHPLGKRNTGIPRWVVDIAHRWGLSWGGDYVSRPDEMHWEFLGTPADVAKYPLREQQTVPPPAAQPSPATKTEEVDDVMFTYRDERDSRVWIVERGQRRHVDRPELDAYKAAGVLDEPKKLTAEQAAVMEWNYPEKK